MILSQRWRATPVWILDGGTSLVFPPAYGHILLLNMRPITAAISVTRFTTANPHESVGIHIFLVSYLSKRAFVLVSPNVAVVIRLSLPFAQVSGPKSLSKPSPMGLHVIPSCPVQVSSSFSVTPNSSKQFSQAAYLGLSRFGTLRTRAVAPPSLSSSSFSCLSSSLSPSSSSSSSSSSSHPCLVPLSGINRSVRKSVDASTDK